MVKRIDALRGDVRAARTEAASRQSKPTMAPSTGAESSTGAAKKAAAAGTAGAAAGAAGVGAEAGSAGTGTTGSGSGAGSAAAGSVEAGAVGAGAGAAARSASGEGSGKGISATAKTASSGGSGGSGDSGSGGSGGRSGPGRSGGAGGGTGPIGHRPELHPPYPRPQRHRRAPAVVALGLLIIVGVVIGILATSNGHKTKPSPIAAYLSAHVAKGTPLALVATGSNAVPSAYPTVAITPSNLKSATTLTYAVGPDPITAAGTALATYVEGHDSLVAVDPGKASLWKVTTTEITPGTTTPPTTAVPATTTPTTVPVTSPPTTVAPTTVPTTVAPTTLAPAPTTTPSTPATTTPPTTPPTAAPPTTSTSVPSTTTPPPSTTPPPTANSPPTAIPNGSVTTTITVTSGESMWSIAQSVVQQHYGSAATSAQVTQYWGQLVSANSGHLPIPGQPGLIFSGTILTVPAVG